MLSVKNSELNKTKEYAFSKFKAHCKLSDFPICLRHLQIQIINYYSHLVNLKLLYQLNN